MCNNVEINLAICVFFDIQERVRGYAFMKYQEREGEKERKQKLMYTNMLETIT